MVKSDLPRADQVVILRRHQGALFAGIIVRNYETGDGMYLPTTTGYSIIQDTDGDGSVSVSFHPHRVVFEDVDDDE